MSRPLSRRTRAHRRTPAFALACVILAATGGCGPGLRVEPLVAIDGERIESDASHPYERGKRFLRDGRFGVAIQEFRAALAREPRSIMVLNGIGIAYDELGRFDLAERYYHRALALQPYSSETLNNIGYAALRRGLIGRARSFFERARAIAPDEGIVLANLDLLRQAGPGGVTPVPGAPIPTVEPGSETWVARLDTTTQLLVTRPDPELRVLAATYRVHPAYFSVP